MIYLNSKDYLIKRLFLNYKLRDIKPQDIGELLEKEKTKSKNNKRQGFGGFDMKKITG